MTCQPAQIWTRGMKELGLTGKYPWYTNGDEADRFSALYAWMHDDMWLSYESISILSGENNYFRVRDRAQRTSENWDTEKHLAVLRAIRFDRHEPVGVKEPARRATDGAHLAVAPGSG